MTTHLDELIELCRHPAIQERRGEWKVGDIFYCSHCKGGLRFIVGRIAPNYLRCAESDHLQFDCTWIPLFNDPIQPERGLIGLVKNLVWLMPPSDSYVLERSKNRWKCSTEDREYYGPTAEIAVAKAVIEQYRKEA